MFLHLIALAGCLSFPSDGFRSSACQRNIFASFGLANKHFRRGIIGRYQATFAGVPFVTSTRSSTPSSPILPLYRETPHTRHECKFANYFRYRIQSFQHACIFSTSSPKGQSTFFALYVFVGNSFPSGSMSPRRHNKSVKLLSDHLLLAFSFNSSSTPYNNVNLALHPGKSGFSEALINPKNCSYSQSVPYPLKSCNICSRSGPDSASFVI